MVIVNCLRVGNKNISNKKVIAIPFNKMQTKLKRYSFDSKMNLISKCSSRLMTNSDKITLKKDIKTFPWELEILASISLMADEWKYDQFNENSLKKYIQIISDHQVHFLTDSDSISLINGFGISMGMMQLHATENYLFKLYRYLYIFEFKNHSLDMKDHFLRKFEINYRNIINNARFIVLLIEWSQRNNQSLNMDKVFGYINPAVIDILSISRGEFQEKQKFFINNPNDFYAGMKVLFQFPFITFNEKLYLPNPHLLMRAITDSMLYRLTENNNAIRELIGNTVLESYLFHLFDTFSNYDEIYSELKYGHSTHHSKDLMIRKDDKCILFDSKSTVPPANLRKLEKSSYESHKKILVEHVVKMYKHIKEEFNIKYNPFDISIDIDNVFGIVVLLENSYFSRRELYKLAASQLNILLESEEYLFLISKIKLLSFYDIEAILFYENDIFEIISGIEKKEYYSLTFLNNLPNKISGKVIRKLKRDIDEAIINEHSNIKDLDYFTY